MNSRDLQDLSDLLQLTLQKATTFYAQMGLHSPPVFRQVFAGRWGDRPRYAFALPVEDQDADQEEEVPPDEEEMP
jgi:hypothetical protein